MRKSIAFFFVCALLCTHLTGFAIDLNDNVVAHPNNPTTQYTEKDLNNDYRYKIRVKVPVEHHGRSYEATYYFHIKTGEIISASIPAQTIGNYITIPETLEGYPVKHIGKEAFAENDYLCQVIFPESIESIGENAFKDCRNLYVAKMNNPEKSRLKKIEQGAFHNCPVMFEAPIYDGIEFIGENAFVNAKALTEVTIPDSLTHLGANAFYGSSLSKVSIAETLIDIGAHAFTNTPWLNDYDADFVVEGNYVLLAYKGTSADIVLPNNIYHLPDKIFANNKRLTSITFNSRLRSIGDYAFEGCSQLASVTIPDTVRTVGDGIFKDCTALTVAKLPTHLTKIPPYTFYATKISDFDLSNITHVGEYAFYSSGFAGDLSLQRPMAYVGKDAFASTKLTSLTVTDNVYLDEAAFAGTKTLENVNIDATVKQMGGHVFSNTPWHQKHINTEYLLVGDGILITHTNSTHIEILTVPQTVKSVASNAFTSSGGYGTIVLPNTITELGDYALAYCTANSVVLPNSIIKMGKGVFKNSRVSSVVWPKNLKEIPDETFQNSRLASFNFAGITAIGNYAFNNVYFKTVEIGDSVEKIGDYAFRGGTIKLHHLPAVMGEFPFGNNDTANWNFYPEYYVDPDVFEYNSEEDYVVLPDWVDYYVYITMTPRIIESGEDYVVVKFNHFPPKNLGAYYGSNWSTIDKSHFTWIDDTTVKISDALSYKNQSITFFEHYSGMVYFQYNPLKLTGMGRSNTSFTPENFSVGVNASTRNYNTYYLTRCNTLNDSVNVTFTPTTGQTFEIYKDEECTQWNGNTIHLSNDPVTVWVKIISENLKHSAVFPWILEYYAVATAPSFSVSEPYFKDSMEIAFSTVDTGATLYYTTDGTEPSKTNGILYTSPFTITETTQIKVISYVPHKKTSPVSTKTYIRGEDLQIAGLDLSAKYVTFTLNSRKAIYNKYLSALVSTDGKTWIPYDSVYLSEDDPTFVIDGFMPDTKYYLKLVLPDTEITSNVVEFTTKSFDEITGFSYDERGRICGMPEGDYIEIPEVIAGKTVVGITPYAYRFVYGTIFVPKTVTMISPIGINGSVNFAVAEDNPSFCALDGSLYNKNMTKLIRSGFSGKASNKEMTFIVPSTVKEIGTHAFYDTYYTNIILNEGLETIREDAISSYEINLLRIPGSVKTIGSNLLGNRPAAIIFMGDLPGCYEDTFHDSAMLYSARENTSLNGIPVRKTPYAYSNFSSFFTPSIYNYTVDISWCSELDPNQNISILCRVLHTDGSMEILEKKLSECYGNSCFFNTKSEIASVKLFLLDTDTLTPMAADISWD
ncbi:MAG: leucine-rich repeat protein [Clostridia bacterium]|nr:leucine-rich repeat protein [Clostridia bacterium]